MALVLADRVLETCTSPGTGTVSLLGAVVGYQTFLASVGNGNTTYYTIADQSGANWEVGIGTVSTGPTLARTTILASSNAGALVDFSSGTQNVFVTYPAEKSVNKDASGNVSIGSGTFTAAQIIDSALTSGRITFATTSGQLTDDADLTFDGVTITSPQMSASNGIFVNNQTIGTSYSIPSGYSAMSSGPVTTSGGVTVTVPAGSRWVVL